MVVTALFFAGLRDRVGEAERRISVASGETIGGVWSRLLDDVPGLAAYRGVTRFALNGAFADAEQALGDGDEIAFLPPMSGG